MKYNIYHSIFNSIKLIGYALLLSACTSPDRADDRHNLDEHAKTGFYKPNSGILVKYEADVSFADRQSIQKSLNLQEISVFSFISDLVLVQPVPDASIEETISELMKSGSIVYAEPDYSISNPAISPPKTDLANSFIAPAIDGASINQLINSKSVIAVLDTGIDLNHGDISQYAWINRDEIPNNNIDDDLNGWVDDRYGWNFASNNNIPIDDNGHGTEVTGVITGNFDDKASALSDSIKVVSLKVLDKNGEGNVSSILGAFDYIYSNKITLSNSNWVLPSTIKSKALKDAIQQLYNTDHLLIVAAGDESKNLDTSPQYPMSYAREFSNILTVTATDFAGSLATFSNYGKESVQIAAYGGFVKSTSINNTFDSLNGTAVSGAIVSSVAVKVQDAYTTNNANDVSRWILNNVQRDASLENRVSSSAKLVNPKELLLQLDDEKRIRLPVDVDSGTIQPIDDITVTEPIVNTPVAVAFVLEAPSTSISVGNTLNLNLSGGTAPYIWTNSNPSVASISESGLLSALAEGSTNLSVTDANNIQSNNITIEVIPMTIDPQVLGAVVVASREQLNAVGGLGPYLWSVSDESIAKIIINPVESSNAELVSLKAGVVSVTLTDSLGNTAFIDNINVTIPPGLLVNPDAVSLNLGQQFSLNVSGGTAPYTFSSSNSLLASVDQGGVITAHAEGNVILTVRDSSGFEKQISIKIDPKLSLTVIQNTLAVNQTMQINVAGDTQSLSWASTDSRIISVSSSGVITANSIGIAKITAMDTNFRAGSITLEVRSLSISSPTDTVYVSGASIQLNATGGAAPYIWSINNNSIASITAEGVLTGLTAGSVTVSVVDAEGFYTEASFLINPAPLTVSQSNLVVSAGNTTQLDVSGGSGLYTWGSDNISIANVNNQGLVTAVALGNTAISVSDSDGQVVRIPIEVKQIGIVVNKTRILVTDAGLQLTVTGGVGPYSWTVDDAAIASINSSGMLLPLFTGVVKATVIDTNLLSASIDITVDVNPLFISPANTVMSVSQSKQFFATGGDNNYFWKSSDNSILSVDQTGLAQSLSTGTVDITLTDGVAQSVSAVVEIRNVIIESTSNSITVGEPALSLTVSGGVAPYTWSVNNETIATVSSDGFLTPIAAGSITITVTDTDGVSGDYVLTVNPAVVVFDTLSVNSLDLLLKKNENFQLVAAGGDSVYTWSSLNTGIATVSNAGLINAKSPGNATIKLTDGSGQELLINVEVREVSINNSVSNMLVGDTASFSATGGIGPYLWSSNDTSVISVNSNGVLTAITAGSVLITATDVDGFSATVSVTVNFPALRINNTSYLIGVGDSVQLSVTGGDGNYNWSSSNTSVVSVSSSGRVSANGNGTATIGVTDGTGARLTVDFEVREVTLSASTTSIIVGDILQINANGGNAPYNWSSNNSSVATVNSNGQITAQGSGSVTISATDSDGFGASITISVSAPAPAPAPAPGGGDGGGGGGGGGGH